MLNKAILSIKAFGLKALLLGLLFVRVLGKGVLLFE